jgi:lipoprotein-anchoring transpeptidase ErfK/SrfK
VKVIEGFEMVRVSGLCTSVVSGRFWCIAVVATASAIGTTSRADAALYYWQDQEPTFYQPSPFPHARRPKAQSHSAKKQAVEKEVATKPQGPLIIAVSISKQQLKIYDANGFFAQSPVSSGMPGHSTPMGVFSVIQKHKLHHSNIYSNAPMPYMQRITWSGVALHAGVLPGYPASHGCIRMPMSFAVKMWNWTKMGARVLVTPGETTPAPFSHPLLPAFKLAPQPVVAGQPMPDEPVAAKADKGAPEKKPSQGSTELELRSTVGHGGAMTPAADFTPVTLRDQTHTADAKSTTTMSDAPSDRNARSRENQAAATGKPSATKADSAMSATIVDVTKPDAAETSRSDETKPVTTDAPKQDAANADAIKSNDKQTDGGQAASDAAQSAPDGKKDQSRVIKPDLPKRTGQIAVLISRKDSKIYVRQNFAPLFEAAVTIAPSDRPLGTHVFTADLDRADPNVLHWSVISLPASSRSVMRSDAGEFGSRHRKNMAPLAEAKPLPAADGPAEALDRITIPGDVMARIAEALTTGGSIIVSDQGINQGETGEGTDFIVSLR